MYEIGLDFIQKLKKSNVSKDAEKTKARFQELWKDATKPQKAKVLADAGIVRATVYRIYGTGVISAKLVIAASQIFNISPYYMTGEADEPGEYSLDVAKDFLVGRGYEKLVRSQLSDVPVKPKRSRASKPAPEVVPETGNAELTAVAVEPDPPAVEVPALEEDEIIALLRALAIRSRVNLSAKKTLDGIVMALMS